MRKRSHETAHRDEENDSGRLLESEEDQYNMRAAKEGLLTREQLLAIDLSLYDSLVTYPTNKDWAIERDKILFLQTAVRIGIPFHVLVEHTVPHFGRSLNPPPEACVTPARLPAFSPPSFDVARQTPEKWGMAADSAWKAYRDDAVQQLSTWRQAEIRNGTIKEFKQRRGDNKRASRKGAIVDENTAFEWAVHWFFATPPSAIARMYPPPNGYSPIRGRKAVEERRKRANQIAGRAHLILKRLGLVNHRIPR